MRAQPYFWPLIAHVIAMSTVVWNPLLFFWLTRKQKRSKLGGILHTSEVITSLASRINSLRSTSNGSTNEAKLKKRQLRLESEKKKMNGNGNDGGAFACQNRSATFNGRQSSRSVGVVASTPRSSIQSNGTSITRPLVVSTSPEHPSPIHHPMIQKTVSLKNDYYNMI
uniref:G-protein coupled receptors family 1 profile domain-containing protein n=1 Tax=Panagrolaimus superbus TaxID=310955 RepID=A0A914YL38_9BILA